MDPQKLRCFQDLLAGLSRRDPASTLQALSGLLADPENPDTPAVPRSRRQGRHRQWVASLGFSSLTGITLPGPPKVVPLRMPLGLSLEYLFKNYGIHLMLFPMDFAPDSGEHHAGAAPDSGGFPATPSALALGFQVGVLRLDGDHPVTVGLEVRFIPTKANDRADAAPGNSRRPRFPGTWQIGGFAGYHFPLVDFN